MLPPTPFPSHEGQEAASPLLLRKNRSHLTHPCGKRAHSDLPQLPLAHASPVIWLLSSNNLMNHTVVGGSLFVILLRKGRKAAEISTEIQHHPALASSGKALSLGWQVPGTGRSAEISVYLIFFPHSPWIFHCFMFTKHQGS